jgi:hypothetical protein
MKVLEAEKVDVWCLKNHNLRLGKRTGYLAVYEEETTIGRCWYEHDCDCPPSYEVTSVLGTAWACDGEIKAGDTELPYSCCCLLNLRSNDSRYSEDEAYRKANAVTPSQAMANLRLEWAAYQEDEKIRLERMTAKHRKDARAAYRALLRIEKEEGKNL